MPQLIVTAFVMLWFAIAGVVDQHPALQHVREKPDPMSVPYTPARKN